MDKQAIIEWADNFVENLTHINDWWKAPEGALFQTTSQSSREIQIHKGIYAIANALQADVTVCNRYAWMTEAGLPLPNDAQYPWEHSFQYKGVKFYEISDYKSAAEVDSYK